MKLLDLSHKMTPGKEEYLLELKTYSIEELLPQYNRRPEDWYILQEVHFITHVGTHIESPYHHRKCSPPAKVALKTPNLPIIVTVG